MPSIQCPDCGERIPLDSGFGRPGDKRFFCLGCDALFGLTGGAERLALVAGEPPGVALDLSDDAAERSALTA